MRKILNVQQYSIVHQTIHTMYNSEAQMIQINSRSPQESPICPKIFSSEFYQIQQYLSLDFFPQCQSMNLKRCYNCDSKIFPLASQPTKQLQKIEKPEKSIFHNFQKNLINLIRKTIHIKKNKYQGQHKKLGFKLWTAFTSQHCYSKKILNLLFGIKGNDGFQNNLTKILQDFPSFKTIYQRYSIEDISSAQEQLRREIVRQARYLEKDLIRSNSMITKFENFYLYFLAFIDDLQTGSFGRRMSKATKSKVIKAITIEKRVQNVS